MASTTVTSSATVIGKSFTRSVPVTADGSVCKDPTLPAAKTGVLTTRTNDSSGTLTMQSGHGITTGARLDLYWDGGKRIGITVGTVSGNSVPLASGGTGGVLPAQDAAVTAMVPQLETFPIPSETAMVGLFVGCNAPAAAVFRDATPSVLATLDVDGAVDAYIWESTSGVDNPFGDPCVDVYLSHGDASNAQQVNVVAFIN